MAVLMSGAFTSFDFPRYFCTTAGEILLATEVKPSFSSPTIILLSLSVALLSGILLSASKIDFLFNITLRLTRINYKEDNV